MIKNIITNILYVAVLPIVILPALIIVLTLKGYYKYNNI